MKENKAMGIPTLRNSLIAILRIIVPLYAIYILFALSIFLLFVPMEKQMIMDQKKEMLRAVTDTVLSLLSEYDQQTKAGELTLEQARQRAIKRVRNLRYGPENKDYFWIVDMQHRMIVNPFVREFEGKDLSNFADAQGKKVFVASVRTVELEGDGYVDYLWQWKDDPEKVVPKISYVKGFSPWGWVIGSGIYVEDTQKEIKLIMHEFVKIFSGVLLILILLSFYITWQVIKIEKKKSQAERAKYLEEVRLKKLLELSQMSDASLGELTAVALEQAIELTQSDVGYIAFLDEKETLLTMHTWSKKTMKQCEIEDKTLNLPVEETGMWAETMRTREAVVINDYKNFNSPQKKGCPRGHINVLRFMNIPVFDSGKIVALSGVGNKEEAYNESDVRQLKLTMDGMWKIIQKKQSENNLRKSEERYRLLAENATDNIWILQLADLTFSYISPSIEGLLGYSPQELIDKGLERHMTKASWEKLSRVILEELEMDDQEGVDPKRSRVIEVEQTKKDGAIIWTEATACFLRDKEGKPDRILGITRNITERKQLENRLRQVQKMEALGTLAGGIAHDFNNILSSILGFTELAKLGAKGDEETREILDQVLAAGIRARELVKHILTFSRRADVQKHVIQITPLIKECLRFLRVSLPANIDIRRHLDVADRRIMADPTQIHQVLMNFFTNAVYAMKPSGGMLDVRLESIEIKASKILLAKEITPGRYLRLTVADTGCGIPKEDIGRIFEPFFTTKARGEGTGMGLSIVYGIVKEMGGAISVDSEPGVGTTFQVMLPEHTGESAINEFSDEGFSMTGQGRILLVDDDVSIVDWTSRMLSTLGYTVVRMGGGREALEIFKQDTAGFDLVLTDMAMPHMTGLELSKQVNAMRPDIPILLCTGFSEGLTSERMKESGIHGMIMKPMIASELALAVHNALNRKEKERPL